MGIFKKQKLASVHKAYTFLEVIAVLLGGIATGALLGFIVASLFYPDVNLLVVGIDKSVDVAIACLVTGFLFSRIGRQSVLKDKALGYLYESKDLFRKLLESGEDNSARNALFERALDCIEEAQSLLLAANFRQLSRAAGLLAFKMRKDKRIKQYVLLGVCHEEKTVMKNRILREYSRTIRQLM